MLTASFFIGENIMTVEMRALRRCYVPSLQGEFKAGQVFQASDEREARRLDRRKLAEYIGATKENAALEAQSDEVEEVVTLASSEDAEKLRQQYKQLTGNDPDKRWGTNRLTREITSNAQRYNRRDMRAEDE